MGGGNLQSYKDSQKRRRKFDLLVQSRCLQAWLSLFSDAAEQFLNLSDGTARIQALGTRTCAIHDRMTPIDTEWITQVVQTRLGRLIARVDDPTVGLHEHGWAEILVAIPPVRGTRCRAASAQNALVQAVKLCAIVDRLQVLSFAFLLGGDVATMMKI